jgi:hypothetical protein
VVDLSTDELMEILEEHKRRLRRLERMLEDRISESEVDYRSPIYFPEIPDEDSEIDDYDETEYDDCDSDSDPFDNMPCVLEVGFIPWLKEWWKRWKELQAKYRSIGDKSAFNPWRGV